MFVPKSRPKSREIWATFDLHVPILAKIEHFQPKIVLKSTKSHPNFAKLPKFRANFAVSQLTQIAQKISRKISLPQTRPPKHHTLHDFGAAWRPTAQGDPSHAFCHHSNLTTINGTCERDATPLDIPQGCWRSMSKSYISSPSHGKCCEVFMSVYNCIPSALILKISSCPINRRPALRSEKASRHGV